MGEFYFDSSSAGDGTNYIDSGGAFIVPASTYFFDSFAHGDGSIYYESLLARAVGGAYYYFMMMQ